MEKKKVYFSGKIFTGDQWLSNHAVVVDGNTIEQVVALDNLREKEAIVELKDKILAPAFIDLQIYGANRKLFSVYPSVDALYDLFEYCSRGGAALFQPTVATNTMEVFYRCIDAAKEYRQQGGKGMIGLHLEGPWINAEKRGAHKVECIQEPTLKEVKGLLEYGKGIITMITIAPEVCSDEVIELIQSYNIIVSAGHSNATYHQAIAAFDKGIQVVTHLYNAMSPLQHREPGLVGASFLHQQVRSSIIPDGYHVDFRAVKIAKQMMKERLFAITDAVTETSLGFYPHQLDGDKYISEGILSGSALTMHKAFINLVRYADIPVEEALRMCSLYPAQVMHLDKQYGKIAPGYTAQFLVLDEDLNLVQMTNNEFIKASSA
ncbi:N-acetylglucosamine-6-phosphate deacetylase [Chitinophagaceae bacterium LB-8]|uniref:N-acetylglucosamine-6-phosphate deacetylase n=1 Tax=Paraflavisolibacter caeni TaxID=2982496 RepID=A0A9X3BAH2_9BACT|nr:N-acetylglucosamine-6-phosphate deacetylase [Paraflavisolibacter caeni]MCU7552771.1 N-acetylglucosamine-6-phosphate deacetylase [Paraflavisolibacter caeni]